VASEDYDMWLRIAKIAPVDYVDQEKLLLYRVTTTRVFKGAFAKWRRNILIATRYAPYAGKRLYIHKLMLSTLKQLPISAKRIKN